MEFVELGGCEVANDSAAHTDVVMVRLGVGIEVDGVAQLAVGGDEVKVVENPEGAVDGVEGDAGHAVLKCKVNGLGIGVIEVRCDFAEDLKTLVGQLDSCFAGLCFEMLDATIDFA